jgi:NAD(P)-dependent dehydrogenase (short-subunit alcohol dehydrogenase family)
MSDSTARTVLLTGATRGLGRALVDRFVDAGCIVWGCGRSRRAIEELSRRYPPPHRFAVVDVSRSDDVSDWAEDLLASSPPPDLLLNNAALINRNASLWVVPPEEFASVVDVNIRGSYHVIREFVPAMIARGRGVIVNFSSGWGRSTAADVAPYCATKWAIEGMTQALAQELPRGLAAVALNPGVIDTDMLRSCFGEQASHYASPEDWGRRAAPFLLSLTAAENGRALTVPA